MPIQLDTGVHNTVMNQALGGNTPHVSATPSPSSYGKPFSEMRNAQPRKRPLWKTFAVLVGGLGIVATAFFIAVNLVMGVFAPSVVDVAAAEMPNVAMIPSDVHDVVASVAPSILKDDPRGGQSIDVWAMNDGRYWVQSNGVWWCMDAIEGEGEPVAANFYECEAEAVARLDMSKVQQ